MNTSPGRDPLAEVAALFLRLGFTAFGGPLAHIAMMETEVVTLRGWMTRGEFLDLVGATNLIPGPNSTQLALHIGKRRAGWAGLLVAGACFIGPAVVMVFALAVLYARYGTLPQTRGLLFGVQPVVLAVVVQALLKFAPTALKSSLTVIVASAAFALAAAHEARMLAFGDVSILLLAAACGLIAGFWNLEADRRTSSRSTDPSDTSYNDQAKAAAPEAKVSVEVHPSTGGKPMPMLLVGAGSVLPFTPTVAGLFWTFTKIGCVLYGSGYVLLAFLRADLVERLHWLTDKQLLDAVAIGQLTPGPLSSSATFVGYQIGGPPGAAAATVGIFLPSFVFVALLSLVLDKLRPSPVLRSFLDAVNAASLALMALVCLHLGRFALIAPLPSLVPCILFVGALAVLLRTRTNSVWLLAGGAAVGLGLSLVEKL